MNKPHTISMRLNMCLLVIFASVVSLMSPIVYAEDTTSKKLDENYYSFNDIYYYDPTAVDAPTCAFPVAAGGGAVGAVGAADSMATVGKDFTLGSDNKTRAVNLARQLKTDFSLTDAQAAGIVGNFMHESGGPHLPPDINENTRSGAPPAYKGGYGWAQWTGGRQTIFIDYSIKNGYMASKTEHATDAANYAYLKYELTKTETGTIPAVVKTTTTADATRAFEHAFERAGKPLIDARIKYAEQVFTALQAGGDIGIVDDAAGAGSAGGPSGAGCEQGAAAGATAQGQVFDTIVFPLALTKKGIRNPEIFKNGTTNRAGHPYIAFDIYARAGDGVVALTGGVITSVKADGSMGGNVTIYDSAKDLHVYYTHMTPLGSLKTGQTITPGMALGSLVSVKNYPSINTDHLHIDAGAGKYRLRCDRNTPDGAGCSTRVDIGPDLYKAWEKLPE